jgi:hypothetical protein
MKFYVVNVDATACFDIVVEAEDEGEAAVLAKDEAKKRIRSVDTLDLTVWGVRESDEK